MSNVRANKRLIIVGITTVTLNVSFLRHVARQWQNNPSLRPTCGSAHSYRRIMRRSPRLQSWISLQEKRISGLPLILVTIQCRLAASHIFHLHPARKCSKVLCHLFYLIISYCNCDWWKIKKKKKQNFFNLNFIFFKYLCFVPNFSFGTTFKNTNKCYSMQIYMHFLKYLECFLNPFKLFWNAFKNWSKTENRRRKSPL